LCRHHRSLDRAWLSMTAEAIDADVQRLGRLADAGDPVRRGGLPDTGGGNRHQPHLNPGFEAFKPGQSIRHVLDRHEVHRVFELGHRGIAMSVTAELAAPHRFWPHRSSSVEAGIHACMPRPRVWRDLFMSPIISVDVGLMSGVRPDITTLDSSGAHAFMSVVGRRARVLKQPDNRHRSTMPRAARCSTSNALPDITRQHRDR
jgi:hypothetical protein